MRTSLYHRLRLAIAWQWSRGVMVADFVRWFQYLGTAAALAIVATVAVAWFLTVSLVCAAYKYTLGLATVAAGMSEGEVARLRRIIHTKETR